MKLSIDPFKTKNIIDVPLDPSQPDALGMEDYVNGAAQFLKTSSMPITMSIQGAWGSGKTSFMLKLRQELCENVGAPYYSVWVRAWEHSSFAGQGDGSAPAVTMVSMLNSMIRDIRPIVEENKSKSEQFKEKGKSALAKMRKLPVLQMMAAGAGGFMLSAAAQAAANALGATAKLAAAANAPQTEDDAPDSGENPLSRLRSDLAENIRFCVERSGRRGFIFFIDDLDRLAPGVAVGFIELLKNIFDLDHCIFVLAIDYDVVVKGLKDKFGEKTESNEHEFRSFFDKIIQVPFSMPVGSYDMRLFLQERFAGIEYFNSKELKAILRRRLADDLDDLPDLLDEEAPDILSLCARIVSHACGPNPRSVIRMLNTLNLIRLIQKRKEDFDDNDPEIRALLFAVIALQMSFERLYELLVAAPDFTAWNNEFALRQNIAELDEARKNQASGLNLPDEWMHVVSRVCRSPRRTVNAVELLRIILALADRLSPSGGDTGESRNATLSMFLKRTMSSQTGGVQMEALPAELSAGDQMRLRFWSSFCTHASANTEMTQSFNLTKPGAYGWYVLSTGFAPLKIELIMRTRMKVVQAGLSIEGKDVYAAFLGHEDAIDTMLGEGGIWKESARFGRIYVERHIEPENEASWEQIFGWFCRMSLLLKKIAVQYGGTYLKDRRNGETDDA